MSVSSDVLAKFGEGLGGRSPEIWCAMFARERAFAEHAIGQLDDEAFFKRPAPGVNSVAIIVQHMAGNMMSRSTDFLTSDGEKPWRNRDGEFEEPRPTAEGRAEVMQRWDEGWSLVLGVVGSLGDDDLQRTVHVRTKPHSVEAAVLRQIDHYAFHVGQIVTTARILVPHDRWDFFTIPPGGSAALSREMMGGSE